MHHPHLILSYAVKENFLLFFFSANFFQSTFLCRCFKGPLFLQLSCAMNPVRRYFYLQKNYFLDLKMLSMHVPIIGLQLPLPFNSSLLIFLSTIEGLVFSLTGFQSVLISSSETDLAPSLS